MTAAREESLRSDTRGAVYVEFLLAFIPLFFMWMGMIQGALLYAANLVVSHSANQAARAAIVVLPDDPEEYDGEAVNTLDDTGSGTSSSGDAVLGLLSRVGLGGGAPPAAGSSGGARLNAIRSAASIPLLSVSPSLEQLTGDTEVYKAIGGNPGERAAVGAALYNRGAMAVTFPERPGSDRFRTRFGPNDDVTVRVTYMFHCGVPLANRLLCDDYLSLRTGIPTEQLRELSEGGSPEELQEKLRRLRHSQERLRSAQPGMNELSQAQAPLLGAVTILTGSRFIVLRAEATMRNQGAGYTYGR